MKAGRAVLTGRRRRERHLDGCRPGRRHHHLGRGLELGRQLELGRWLARRRLGLGARRSTRGRVRGVSTRWESGTGGTVASRRTSRRRSSSERVATCPTSMPRSPERLRAAARRTPRSGSSSAPSSRDRAWSPPAAPAARTARRRTSGSGPATPAAPARASAPGRATPPAAPCAGGPRCRGRAPLATDAPGGVGIQVGDGPERGDAHRGLGRAQERLDHRGSLAAGQRAECLEERHQHRVVPLGVESHRERRRGGAIPERAEALGSAGARGRVGAGQLRMEKPNRLSSPSRGLGGTARRPCSNRPLGLTGHREESRRGGIAALRAEGRPLPRGVPRGRGSPSGGRGGLARWPGGEEGRSDGRRDPGTDCGPGAENPFRATSLCTATVSSAGPRPDVVQRADVRAASRRGRRRRDLEAGVRRAIRLGPEVGDESGEVEVEPGSPFPWMRAASRTFPIRPARSARIASSTRAASSRSRWARPSSTSSSATRRRSSTSAGRREARSARRASASDLRVAASAWSVSERASK
jgi:hypothetical protein